MNELKIIKKFSFDVSWVFISSISTLLISFILKPILARWLGPDGLGLYSIIFSIYGIFLIFNSFGIPLALTKFTSQYKDNKEFLSKYISIGFVLSLLFGVITSIILVFAARPISIIYRIPELEDLLILISIIFPFASIYESQVGILNGLKLM